MLIAEKSGAAAIKKAARLLVTCVFTLLFAACGSAAGEGEGEDRGSSYTELGFPIPAAINVSDSVLGEDFATLLDGGTIIRIDHDGTVSERLELSQTASFSLFDIDENANYNTLALYLDDADKMPPRMRVFCYATDGTLLDSTALATGFAATEDSPYVNAFLAEGGHFYVQSMTGLYVYDGAGSLIHELLEDVPRDVGLYANSLLRLRDGRIGASYALMEADGNSALLLRVFDPGSDDSEEHRISVPDNPAECVTVTLSGASAEYDFLLGDHAGLYEYNLATGAKKLLMSFPDHGLSVGRIADLYLKADGDIVCLLKSDAGLVSPPSEIAIFSTKAGHGAKAESDGAKAANGQGTGDPGSSGEKAIIRLAVIEPDRLLNNYISAFNRENPHYTVQATTYSQPGGDREDAQRRLSIDLAAGSTADIVAFDGIFDRGMRIQSYADKGLFADLYALMDDDPGFDRNDYLGNVFSALEGDGQLHSITPLLSLMSVLAKTADVGEAMGWTIDEFLAFLDEKPAARYIIENYDRESFVQLMITLYFTDAQTGQVIFEREAFQKILAAAERFPVDGLPAGIDFYDFAEGAKDGDPLTLRAYVNSFRAIARNKVYYFGEDVTFKGFPTPEGTGAYFSPWMRFALLNDSPQKDGAWAFIRFMLDEYRDDYELYLPIKISELEGMAAAAMVDPGYFHPTSGEWVEFDHILEFQSEDSDKVVSIFIGNNTAADNAQVMDLIRETRLMDPLDPIVRDIINEEVGAYFTGQKSPDEVADIIENRVRLYIHESE